MHKRTSSISLFLFMTVLLTGGFTNSMIQEAYAATPTISAVTGDSASGDSTATTKIFVTFNEGVNATATDTKDAWSVAGNTVSAVTTIVTGDSTCNSGTGGTTTLTITLGSAISTGAVPKVTYDGTGPNISIRSCTTNQALVNATTSIIDPVDGLRPVASSAATTSSTSIEITMSEDVTNNSAVAGDFTVTGVASSPTVNSLTVSGTTITLGLSAAIVNTDSSITVDYTGGGTDIDDGATNNDLSAFSNLSVTNGVAAPVASGGGSGCDDCEAPTLGMDKHGTRLVSNGFTYNGHAVDVERFFTPYSLITANVGKENKAEFKIYENEGVDNIKHFSFAFGLDKGEIIGKSKAMIELDIDLDGTETVTVTDPENALDNVRVQTSTVSCQDDVRIDCLGVTIYHTFRAPLDFNIVATDVWDFKRNAWQNYYNHGIEVVGESLNPPKEYDGINKGHIYHLTETGKTSAVDDFDNSWSFDHGVWSMDYISQKKIDKIPANGYTRYDSKFDTLKHDQSILAENKLSEICSECFDESFDEINDIFFYSFPIILNKLDDPEIQSNMALESEKAQKTMDIILDPLLYRK